MNLKERLIAQVNQEIENRLEAINTFTQIRVILETFNGLDVEVPRTDSIWASGKTLNINCYTPGAAQEIANLISIELGITLEKRFLDTWGQHQYYGWYDDKIYFRIDGTPPESCQLRRIEKTVMRDEVVYEVVCD